MYMPEPFEEAGLEDFRDLTTLGSHPGRDFASQNVVATVKESEAPYRYLFEEQKISGQRSPDALKMADGSFPIDQQVVPGSDARALVKYLLSLDRSHPLKEAGESAPAAAATPAPAAPGAPAPAAPAAAPATTPAK